MKKHDAGSSTEAAVLVFGLLLAIVFIALVDNPPWKNNHGYSASYISTVMKYESHMEAK